MTFKHEARRPSTTWLVVADRGRARIFDGEWPALDELREIKTLVHPEGELHPRDVESDEPGRLYEAKGPKHAAQAKTDFKHRTAIKFAHQIVRELQKGQDENAFGRLILVAAPLILGVLRE
ncbi:MAG: host attachment protein, partial [Planctomycetaceae bacterium]